MSDDEFDARVSALDPALVVVTAAAGDQVDGALVGFHSQCGIEPRRYAVWLSKPNRTTRLVVEGGASHLVVHQLAADQHDLARRFGSETGDEVDKLAGLSWTPGPSGVPVLDDCPVHVVGRVLEVADVGADHLCVVLEPQVPDEPESAGGSSPRLDQPLRLHQVQDLDAGHAPDEPA